MGQPTKEENSKLNTKYTGDILHQDDISNWFGITPDPAQEESKNPEYGK